jgi:hypothetical protein
MERPRLLGGKALRGTLPAENPTGIAFLDESGAIAHDRFFAVGCLKLSEPAPLTRAVQKFRDRNHWYREIHFAELTRGTLPLYKGVVDVVAGIDDAFFSCLWPIGSQRIQSPGSETSGPPTPNSPSNSSWAASNRGRSYACLLTIIRRRTPSTSRGSSRATSTGVWRDLQHPHEHRPERPVLLAVDQTPCRDLTPPRCRCEATSLQVATASPRCPGPTTR